MPRKGIKDLPGPHDDLLRKWLPSYVQDVETHVSPLGKFARTDRKEYNAMVRRATHIMRSQTGQMHAEKSLRDEMASWSLKKIKDECRRRKIRGFSKYKAAQKKQLIDLCLGHQNSKSVRFKPGTLAYKHRKKPLPKTPKKKKTRK